MEEQLNDKVAAFFHDFAEKTYKKGEILIRTNENPTGIYYIQEGQVKEYAISKNGDEVVVNIFKPFSFFPMSWAVNDTQNDYFFEAMTEVVVRKAPREKVLIFIKNNADVLYDLLRRVYKGTDGLLMRMTYLMSENAYVRLIIELLIFARRFGDNKQQMIELTISEKDLAVQSGMTRETVSREIKVLKDKGLMMVDKNVLCITDVKKLEEELLRGV